VAFITEFGGKVLVVTSDRAPLSLLDLPYLRTSALDKVMRGDETGGRASWLGRGPAGGHSEMARGDRQRWT
jgi:hypothetical protein